MRSRTDRAYAQRRRHKYKKQILIPLIGTAAFLFAAFILYICIFGFGASAESFYKLDVTEETSAAANSENVFYLSGSTLNCADKKGDVLWSVKFTAGAANVSVGDNLICVYSSDFATVLDSNGNHLYTLPSGEFKTKSAACGQNYTAFLSQTENAQYLRVFDKEGSEIYRGEYPDTEILEYGFYGSNDMLYTLTLDTTGISPVSRVSTVSPASKTLTGTVEVSDQLVRDIKFLNTDMILCGTSTLAVYDNFGNQVDSKMIYGLTGSDSTITENGYIYAFLPKSISELTTSCTVRIIGSVSGNDIDTNIQLPPGVEGAYVSKDKLYAVLSQSVYVYKLTGEFEKAVEAPAQITGVSKLSGDMLKINCSGDVYILTLD